MSSHPLIALRKQMKDQEAAWTAALAAGTASDYAEYRALCGKITALQWCAELVKDMERRVDSDGDDML